MESEFSEFEKGVEFIKFTSSGKAHKRIFKLDSKRRVISWKSPKKSESKSIISLDEIQEVREGLKSKEFKKADPGDESKAFSIIYGGKYKSLNIIADSENTKKSWISAIEKMKKSSNSDPIVTFLNNAWKKFDKNNDGKLNFDEIWKLLQSLNCNLSKEKSRSSFDKHAKNGQLDFEAFTQLFNEIQYRSDIEAIFNQIATNEVLSFEAFKKFLTEEQKHSLSDEKIQEIMSKYGSKEKLTFGQFSKYLSLESMIWNQTHLEVYQDMDQPLTHYWINSSHNTYLLEDQLKGPSSVEAYIRALNLGCRCVELDCWDGPDGDPIIYHGHTLTSKIKFKDVIVAVKEYAFKVSKFPVILSLEVHCSVPQQDKMAQYLNELLGDMICKTPLPDDAKFLPSPKSLMNKILIKGKALPKGVKVEEYDTEDESDAESDENSEYESEEENPEERAKDEKEEKEEKEKREKKRKAKQEAIEMKKSQGKNVETPKLKISVELSSLVNYCRSSHFKSFAESKEKFRPNQMCSFGESKALSMGSKHRDQFIDYNRTNLSRIYPGGARVDSSNYEPHIVWNAGCQVVAFNFQTLDRTMQLNIGKFLENGNAGYLLKPDWMREEKPKSSKPKIFKVRIISAQQLPKPNQSTKGEIIDPYVEIDLVGEISDCTKQSTAVITDNGFNPQWNETFEFTVTSPELTLVRFTVYDKDVNSDDFICTSTINFNSMQIGYRHIPVRDSKNTVVEMGYIFVHISIADKY